MRIKKKNIGEDIEQKAKDIAKKDVESLKKDLQPVSQEIQQGIEDITGNPETAKDIADKMAASAIDKAYSDDEPMNEVVDGKHTVEYHSERTDETPFIINGIKWQYVNAIYPDGKRDIGVYRFDHDLTYDFNWFMNEVIPKPGNYNIVDEVAVSDSQRKFMNAVLKCKVEGDCPSEDIRKAAESMSKKEIEDFAYTKGDLPKSVDEDEDGAASRAIQYGQQQGEVGDSEYDEYQTLLRSLDSHSKEIEKGMNDEEPINDLPFESIRPKMTKDELIESVKRNKTKNRKVIKTISVKNLRNE